MGQSCTKQEAKDLLLDNLGLPVHDIEEDCVKYNEKLKCFHTLVSEEWLQKIHKDKRSVLCEELKSTKEDEKCLEEIFQYGHYFPSASKLKKANVYVLKKDICFCIKGENNIDKTLNISNHSTFDVLEAQCVHAQELLKNYLSTYTSTMKNKKDEKQDRIIDWEQLKHFFASTFNQPIINISTTSNTENNDHISSEYNSQSSNFSANERHPFVPVIAIVECSQAVFVFEEFATYSLKDALDYSPAALGKCHSNLTFLLYQILNILLTLRKHQVYVNTNLSLYDFKLFHDTLWVGLSIFDGVTIKQPVRGHTPPEPIFKIYDGENTNLSDSNIVLKEKLSRYTSEWVNCDISNFDYLVILNKLAGKTFGQALNHPVFPWVTDFTSYNGGYRDLKKTKFRLNKGDHQLDATFSSGIGSISHGFGLSLNAIQHHVSDVLSDITYYMYHARQTSKEVLCQHVRSRWVPDEYPANVRRMYNWTPDECIPEFFYDPSIFRSIHEDLADLGFPHWIKTPEEFVQYHYSVLESPAVSHHLHHWIDLVFGYKLEGRAARHAKNVHLGLVDEHKDLKNYGVVQLFGKHHPKRRSFTEANQTTAALDFPDGGVEVRPREFSMSWEYVDLSTKEETPLEEETGIEVDPAPRKGTRSFADVNIVPNAPNTSGDDDSLNLSMVYPIIDKEKVVFDDIMEQTERMLKFEMLSNPASTEGVGQHKFGMFTIFDSKKEDKKPSQQHSNLSDIMKLYLCFIIEITCQKSLRIRTFLPCLEERFEEVLKFLKVNDAVPSWAKSAVKFAIHSSFFEDDDAIMEPTNFTLHSILNSMNSCFNFPAYYDRLFKFLTTLYSAVESSSNPLHDVIGGGGYAGVSWEIEKCTKQLQTLLESLDNEGTNLLLLFVQPLFEKKDYQLSMYLHIFPALSLALGPKRARTVFLKGLQKVFDNLNVSTDAASLLQQSYLSHILQAFGQDYFLSFIMGLVLDILSMDCQVTGTIPHKSSTTTAPSSTMDNSLPSESLISYEVSAYDMKDSISMSSFNLESMFADNPTTTFQMLRDEDASDDDNGDDEDDVSLSDDGNGFNDTLEDQLQEELVNTPTPQSTASTNSALAFDIGLRKSSGVVSKRTHTVLSSQEILTNSGKENMIDVNATSQSLPDFAPSRLRLNSGGGVKNLFSFQSFGSDMVNVVENAPENEPVKSPFTVLLENNGVLKGNTASQDFDDLEEVPKDDDANPVNHLRSDTMVTEDGNQIIDLHQTVVDSLKGFIPWLGPNLTTEFIARPLLRNMSKLLLDVADAESNVDVVDRLLQKVAPYIECLLEVASIYGDNVVIYLYLPHIVQLIENGINYPSVSISLGSQFVSFVQLLMESCSQLQSEVISTHMEEFSVDFFQPLIRLLSTVKPFSTGYIVKEFLSRKMVDILGMFCQKLRREYAQDIMAPLLQQFFSCFDGIYALRVDNRGTSFVARKYSLLCQSRASGSPTPSIQQQATRKITPEERERAGSASSRISKTLSIDDVLESRSDDEEDEDKFADIYATFSPSLAYHAYVLFCRVLGTHYVENTLYNSDLVWQLCTKHDEGLTHGKKLESEDNPSYKKQNSKWLQPLENPNEEDYSSRRVSWQHLDGNWLKNWQRCNESSSRNFQFANCKLQTYAGHSSAIRDIYVADNEHYFLSASRDKTVKLWLLKNHGNGTAHLVCSVTYERHSRAVFAVQGLEAKRVVASCDGEINIWDPVTSDVLNEFSACRGHSITCIRTLPAPSMCVAAATSEGSMRLYDVRQKNFALDWKVSPQTTTGVIRSMCIDTSGTWLCAGFSNGIFSAIDVRAGILRGQARIHDGEILQMEAMSGTSFVSSGVDSVIRVWSEDNSGSIVYKSPSNESFNSLIYSKQQLLWSSHNKLAIHNPDKMSQYNSYKLNPDILKGALSKMAVIPMNKLYLFGNDNGNLVLFS